MLRKHCSDEQLIAHVDGELSRWQESRVWKHLQRCWTCRTRLAEIEEQVRSLTAAFGKQTFPGQQRVERARRRFRKSMEHYEDSLLGAPLFCLLPGFAASVTRSVVAVLCVCGLVAGIVAAWSRRPLEPAELLIAASGAEHGFYQSGETIHQEFRVEVRQTKPVRKSRSGTLEFWSEPRGTRFASQWRDDRGAIRYAAWRPRANLEYSYIPAVNGGPIRREATTVEVVTLSSMGRHGLEPEQIERTFLGWLQNRVWTPISFTSNFRLFSSADGVVAGVERLPAEPGSVFRLWARRESGGLKMEIVMEVDDVTYRPRLQVLRFEDAGRAVELRLLADRNESVAAARIEPAIFEPAGELARPPLRALRNLPDRRNSDAGRVFPAPSVRRLGPDEAEIDDAEVQVLYALHRVRACLGEPVEIDHVSGLGVRVRGLVETTARRSQLLAALEGLQRPGIVSADIGTAEEFLKDSGAVTGREINTKIRVAPVRLPIQDEIEEYYRLRGEAPNRVVQFANEAIAISAAILEDAWALRRLGERFPQRRVERVRPQSRWLLEVMLRDHVEALSARVARSRLLLAPVLSSISPAANSHSAAAPAAERDTAPLLRAVLSLFSNATQVDALSNGLFAGADLPVPAKEAAPALLSALASLEQAVPALEVAIRGEFPGRANLVTERDPGRP